MLNQNDCEEVLKKNEDLVKKNEELMKKNEELVKKNEELEKKNEELEKKNEELVKKNEELVKINKELVKENDKSENKNLQENSNENLSSSSFIKNKSQSNSLSYHIIEEKDSIIYSPENSNFEIKEGILPFSENDSHFICKKCHKIPIVKFNNSLTKFNCSCSCSFSRESSLKNIINEYIVRENDENSNDSIESYLKCKLHNENFFYYCKMDNTHLCRTCLRKKYLHQIHSLYSFDFNYCTINKKKENILTILKEKSKDLNFEINDADLLLNLFSVIFNDFSLYPNYSHFVIIEEAFKFLENFISNKNNNQIIDSLDFQKSLIINNKKILYQNMKNPEIIKEINIVNSNLYDITKLCDLNLVNLEKLYLLENTITNIKPLLKAKFKKIKHLGFGRNKIGDENVPYLLEMKFEQLEELNLFSNNITDCKIFNLQNSQNLPNLKIFYIGNNRIDWTKRNSIDRTYNFKYLTTIGLTSGIFDDNTIENINSFNFSYLKIIYLGRCDIYSLDFVKKLELPCIEEFYLNTTFINEFYPLRKYRHLKIIEMRDNYIENIDFLKSFIEELPELKHFNIKGNNIDMNSEKNKVIIECVKKTRNYLDIII